MKLLRMACVLLAVGCNRGVPIVERARYLGPAHQPAPMMPQDNFWPGCEEDWGFN